MRQLLIAHHQAARLQWAQRHFRWGRQQWAWVLFSDESRFNLSHHDGQIRVLEEEGNVLLIIVSLRGTNLKVGVLRYGVALWAEGKQISLLCKATSMLKVTLRPPRKIVVLRVSRPYLENCRRLGL